MRKRYDHTASTRLFYLINLCYLLVTPLLTFALQPLPRPVGLIVMGAACCLEAILLSLLTGRQAVGGMVWPVEHLILEAPLLVSPDYLVHHAQCPLTPVAHARINAGPSALLLSTCAMLTIPSSDRTPAEQGVMDFLAQSKVEQSGFLAKHPSIGTREANGLTWQICHDGPSLRAYASGDARQVLEACGEIWADVRRTLTDDDRHQLHQLWDSEDVSPMGFAMAEFVNGELSRTTFLGAMLLERSLHPHAVREVMNLQRHGYSVSITGLAPRTEAHISHILGCDELPDESVPTLTIACSDEQTGSQVYQIPEGMRPTNAVGYLRTMHRRLWYQPMQMCLVILILTLCSLMTKLPVYYLALVQLMLLIQSLWAPSRPKPLPASDKRRLAVCVTAIVLLVPGGCLLLSLFIRYTGGLLTSAGVLYTIPFLLLVGSQFARFTTTLKPILTILPAAVIGLAVLAIAVIHGIDLLGSAFALVAGILCALVVHTLLQYAEHR